MLKNMCISKSKFLPYLESSYCNLLMQHWHKYEDRDNAEVIRLVLLHVASFGKTDAVILYLIENCSFYEELCFNSLTNNCTIKLSSVTKALRCPNVLVVVQECETYLSLQALTDTHCQQPCQGTRTTHRLVGQFVLEGTSGGLQSYLVPERDKLRDQTKLLRAFHSWVLKTSKAGDQRLEKSSRQP